MKNVITTLELQPLLQPQTPPCISIFQPTHRRPPETEQDPVRFRNLLNQTEVLLQKQYDARETKALLEPLQFLQDKNFWHGQLDGLAVFCSPNTLQHYRIPMRLPELVVVADTFHLAPLVRFLQTNSYFFVLVLSQRHVRFYQGTQSALGQIEVPGLPQSLEAALGTEQRETFLNYHTTSAGKGDAMFHGHGVPSTENMKAELARFFRVIDTVLWDNILRDERAPLVLAAVDYYHPIYQSITRYQHLAPRGVEGNWDYTSEDRLHAQVWPVAEELFRGREEAALNEYGRLSGQNYVLTDLRKMTAAALAGRIRYLFIAEGHHLWGVWDKNTDTVSLHPSQQDTADDDILDDIGEVVLQRGGEIFILPPERMPTTSSLAAVLRW